MTPEELAAHIEALRSERQAVKDQPAQVKAIDAELARLAPEKAVDPKPEKAVPAATEKAVSPAPEKAAPEKAARKARK